MLNTSLRRAAGPLVVLAFVVLTAAWWTTSRSCRPASVAHVVQADDGAKYEANTEFLASLYRSMVPNVPVTVNGKPITFFRPQTGDWDWYFDMLKAGTWEPFTFQVYQKHVNQHTTVLDVGAWIGPTALFAASLAKAVVAMEPDPKAFAGLSLNAKLNAFRAPLITKQLCISVQSGKAKFNYRGGNSMSGLETLDSDHPGAKVQHTFDIDCMTLPSLVQSLQLQPPFFVKVDVEGYEASLLPSLAEFVQAERPTMYISLHENVKAFSKAEKAAMLKFFGLFPYTYIRRDGGDNKDFVKWSTATADERFHGEVVATWEDSGAV